MNCIFFYVERKDKIMKRKPEGIMVFDLFTVQLPAINSILLKAGGY